MGQNTNTCTTISILNTYQISDVQAEVPLVSYVKVNDISKRSVRVSIISEGKKISTG